MDGLNDRLADIEGTDDWLGRLLMAPDKVAIVHDYLTQRGGAERVVLSMLRLFPDAPLYTALYEPTSTYPDFAEFDVRPLITNRLSSLRRQHRRGLLLYPFAFTSLRVHADVVLCSSSGFAHGIRTSGRKVVYCHTPARWLYDEADTYLASWPGGVSAIMHAVAPALRRWDKLAASSADLYLTNSLAVRDRIKHAYGIDAAVVPPAVQGLMDGTRPTSPGIDPGFVLCVSRLLAYKNVAALAKAFEELPNNRLVIVGTGPEERRLKAGIRSNVTLLGRVTEAELTWLYSNCAGLVAAAHEDFGLTPLEAATRGKPVAALRAGGFLDTVVEGKTGVFFDEPDSRSIAAAVRTLLAYPWDPVSIENHSRRFIESVFADRLMAALATATGLKGPWPSDGVAA